MHPVGFTAENTAFLHCQLDIAFGLSSPTTATTTASALSTSRPEAGGDVA
jgi:hypothetical protein